MNRCPNKNHPLYQELVSLLGSDFDAYNAYKDNNFDIPNYRKDPMYAEMSEEFNDEHIFKTIYKSKIKSKPDTAADIAKELEGGSIDGTVDFEKIDVAKEKAWIKEKLGSSFPVEISESLILGKKWGQFKDGVIKLSEQAAEGTGYHEAFHAVFRMALNDKDRAALIKEVQKMEGHDQMSEGEAEEFMADQFAEYVMMDGNIKLPKQQKSFFEKIFQFIKSFRSGKDITLSEVYSRINKGSFNPLTLDTRTYKFLGEAVDKKIPIEFTRTDDNGQKFKESTLTEQESMEVMEGLDSYFFKALFKNGDPSAVFEKSDRTPAQIYGEALSSIVANSRSIMKGMIANGKSVEQAAEVLMHVYGIGTDFKFIPGHPGRTALFKAHSERLVDYGIKFTLDKAKAAENKKEDDAGIEETQDETEVETLDRAFQFNAVEFDTKDGIPNTVKAMLLGLERKNYTEEGGYETGPSSRNSMGHFPLVGFAEAYNMISNALAGSTGDFTYMMSKLKDYSMENDRNRSILSQFAQRIYQAEATSPEYGQRLKTQFVQAFSKTKYDYMLSLLDEGKIALIDANNASTMQKVLTKWDEEFRASEDAELNENNVPFVAVSDLKSLKEKANGNNKKRKEDAVFDFLDMIGVQLTNPGKTLNVVKGGETLRQKVLATIKGIEEDIVDPYNAKQIKGLLNNLAESEAVYSEDVVELNHVNAEGKRVYSITLHTYLTLIKDKLNQYAGNEAKMREALPFLFNPYTENSKILEALVNGEEELALGLLEGMKISDADGAVTKDLKYTDKVSQFIDATLKGVNTYLRAADRGIENFIGFKSGSRLVANPTDGVETFFGYFMDEVNMAKTQSGKDIKFFNKAFKKNKEGELELQDHNRLKFFSTMFDGAFSKELWEAMYNSEMDTNTFFENNPEVAQEVKDVISNFITNDASRQLEKFKEDAGILEDSELGIDSELLQEFDGDLNKLMEMYVYNSTAAYIEQSKLFTGDPSFFKTSTDFFKRTSMFNSTKKVSRVDSEYNDYAKKNRVRRDGKTPDGTINTVVFEDVKAAASNAVDLVAALTLKYGEQAALEIVDNVYEGYDEADAQGYVTLDEYREIMDRAGDWGPQHEAAYQKMIDGKRLTKEEMVFFHPLKTQYAGPMKDYEGELYVPTAYKHSLFPLIPSMIEGTDLESLNGYMMQNQIGIAQFGSASKFGTRVKSDGSMNKFYNEDGTLGFESTPIAEAEVAAQTIYYDFFGIQVDILGKPKEKITPGSQMAKIIMANLYKDGKPINDKAAELVERYNDISNRLTSQYISDAATKLGVAFDPTTKTIAIRDLLAFKQTLVKASSDKNVDDNILNGLSNLQEGDMIEHLPNGDKIQSVLTSLITKDIMKAKRPGTSKVQVSSTGITSKITRQTPAKKESINVYWGQAESEKSTRILSNLAERKFTWKNREYSSVEHAYQSNKSGTFDQDTYDKYVKVGGFGRKIRGKGTVAQMKAANSLDLMKQLVVESFTQNPNSKAAEKLLQYENFTHNTNELIDQAFLEGLRLAQKELEGSIKGSTQPKLKFYRKENGEVRGMQVLLPHYFKELYGQDVSIDSIKDKRLLELVGFRIPTQGPSSIDLIEVAGFLPEEAGDSIVVPSEHVAKGGSDFDIDKLSIYLPNYKMVDGTPTFVEDNTVKGLQNELLRTQIEITKTDEYFSDMVTPIDADVLSNYSKDITGYREMNPEYKGAKGELSTTDLFLGDTNMEKFRDFLAGKAGVGQTAIHITHHNLAQIAGLHIAEDFADSLFFEHNKNEDGLPSFAQSQSKNGEHYISDMLSGFLNAYVDIAKDPYIFNLNAGAGTANTIFFMLRLGADPKFVMNFMTQPVIVDYIKEQAINESQTMKNAGKEKKKNVIINRVLKKYGGNSSNMIYSQFNKVLKGGEVDRKKVDLYNETMSEYRANKPTVRSLINNHKYNPTKQGQILDQFLMYQEQAKMLQDSVKATAIDTKGMGKNLDHSHGVIQLNKDVNTAGYIKNHNKIYDSTFLGSMKKGLEIFTQGFSSMSIAQTHREQLKTVKEELGTGLTANGKEKLNREVNNAFISFMVNKGLERGTVVKAGGQDVSVGYNRSDVETFLTNDKVKQLKKVFKGAQYKDNVLLKELVAIVDEGKDIKSSGFRMYSKKLDTYKRNIVIDSFQELFDIPQDITVGGKKVKSSLGELLALTTLVQSGVGNNYTSFTDFIPHHEYKKMLKKYYSQAGKVDANVIEEFNDQFYRHNPKYIQKVTKDDISKEINQEYYEADPRSKGRYLKDVVYNKPTDTFETILYERIGFDKSGNKAIFKVSKKGILGNGALRKDYRGESDKANGKLSATQISRLAKENKKNC